VGALPPVARRQLAFGLHPHEWQCHRERDERFVEVVIGFEAIARERHGRRELKQDTKVE
jgi:hypothetical protein